MVEVARTDLSCERVSPGLIGKYQELKYECDDLFGTYACEEGYDEIVEDREEKAILRII